MLTARNLCAALVVAAAWASSGLADGMIVPIRPEHRVRGHWSVKHHNVQIVVRDQVASVSIDQQFVNTGQGMIEVEYLFPVPPDAAIDSMTLLVNGKEYAAKLLKADEARKIYEDIVRSKKDPALLEYVGFGLYRTRAFPLEPGKPARVVVTYTNACKKDGDLVEVWYPLNTEKFSAQPLEQVSVRVDIKSRADITAVYSPTHDLNVERRGPRQVIATYSATSTLPTTDFQLFYKAANEAIGATLLTRQTDADVDGYFMMLVSPNLRHAAQAVVAKDIVVVFDHSGSMSGDKIEQAREAVRYILSRLNREDRFGVVAYNDAVEPFADTLQDVTDKTIELALDRLDRVQASGGTNIHEALQTALKMITKQFAGREDRSGRPRYIIFLTDGLPTIGETDENAILAATRKANPLATRLFAFGVGYDVNVRLLDKLAGENHGKSDYVKPKEPIETKVASLYSKIKNPVMTKVEMEITGLQLRQTYPRQLGDLFEGDQLVVLGRYDCRDVRQLATREAGVHATQLVIRGVYQGKQRAFEYPVQVRSIADGRYEFVETLWAMRRIGFLLDQIQLHGESDEVVNELVKLSRDYGIITPYTSFLADDTVNLARADVLYSRAAKSAGGLRANISGSAGQVAAKNRQRLNEAKRAMAPAEPGRGVSQLGFADAESYEADEVREFASVRQVGNQALYRRGRTWVAANASQLDLTKDADRIQIIDRYSDAYFTLVRANTTVENRILASQLADEELVIQLRGQAYRIR